MASPANHRKHRFYKAVNEGTPRRIWGVVVYTYVMHVLTYFIVIILCMYTHVYNSKYMYSTDAFIDLRIQTCKVNIYVCTCMHT